MKHKNVLTGWDGMGGHFSDALTQFLFTGILKRHTWLWHRLLIMWSQLLDFFWSTFCKLSMLLELKQLQETLVLRKARSLWFLYYVPAPRVGMAMRHRQ